jgi:phage-related protein
MEQKFNVEFLDEAKMFLDKLQHKDREKIIYNIWKSRSVNDPELFKKLSEAIWEFRTLYNNKQYRLLAFWIKRKNVERIVICTHGIVKKTSKMPQKEIDKAERIRIEYLKTHTS